MLVVSPPSFATSAPVMPILPRLRVFDLFGCAGGDWSITLCLTGLSAPSIPGISQCPGIRVYVILAV